MVVFDIVLNFSEIGHSVGQEIAAKKQPLFWSLFFLISKLTKKTNTECMKVNSKLSFTQNCTFQTTEHFATKSFCLHPPLFEFLHDT